MGGIRKTVQLASDGVLGGGWESLLKAIHRGRRPVFSFV